MNRRRCARRWRAQQVARPTARRQSYCWRAAAELRSDATPLVAGLAELGALVALAFVA